MVCDAPSLSRRDTARAVAPERTVTVILTQVTCADKVSGNDTEKGEDWLLEWVQKTKQGCGKLTILQFDLRKRSRGVQFQWKKIIK
jgi:hypothetical protein